MTSVMASTMRKACGITVLCLLSVGAATAQEVIEVRGEDHRLAAGFEELYRIGGIAGDEWEQFGSVANLAFDGAGRLHVFDSQVNRIFVVGADGTLVHQIGREGDGPGEFRSVQDMAVMEDGRIVVIDMGHRAYHVFDSNGDFDRMVRMGGDPSVTIVGDHIAQRGADAVLTTPIGSGLRTWAVESPDGQTPRKDRPKSRPIERITLAGRESVTDTLADGWLPPERDVESNFGVGLPRPFTWSPGLHWGVLPDGSVAFADSTTYAIKIAAEGAGVSRVLTRPFPPEPVTNRLINAERNRRLRELAAIPDERLGGVLGTINGQPIRLDPDVDRQRRRERIENLEFFYELSVIRGLAVAWDGTIWVRRRGEEPESDGPIDLLTPDGTYLGSLPAEGTAIPEAFGPGGLAAYIETDELGVKTVVVGRLSVG